MTDTTQPFETWTVVVDADTAPLQNELKAASLQGRQFSSALVTAFDGIAVKGKGLGDVMKSLALSLSNMVLKAALKPLDQGFNSMLSGLFSGGALGFANGGVFNQGMPVPFASGGVIQSPIAFPLGSGKTGIAGEAGAEAIMPLTRGPDGRLGVAAQGMGSALNVTFNVTATDADSFVRSESQIQALLRGSRSRSAQPLRWKGHGDELS